MDSSRSPFFHLLAALKEYTENSDTHTLPLTSTLPDMKSDTHNYIHLQRLYKTRAEEEKQIFKSHLRVPVDDAMVDSFVKNAHALVVLRGKPWGTFDEDKAALGNTLGACIGSDRLLTFVCCVSGVVINDAQGDVYTSCPLCAFVASSERHIGVTVSRVHSCKD